MPQIESRSFRNSLHRLAQTGWNRRLQAAEKQVHEIGTSDQPWIDTALDVAEASPTGIASDVAIGGTTETAAQALGASKEKAQHLGDWASRAASAAMMAPLALGIVRSSRKPLIKLFRRYREEAAPARGLEHTFATYDVHKGPEAVGSMHVAYDPVKQHVEVLHIKGNDAATYAKDEPGSLLGQLGNRGQTDIAWQLQDEFPDVKTGSYYHIGGVNEGKGATKAGWQYAGPGRIKPTFKERQWADPEIGSTREALQHQVVAERPSSHEMTDTVTDELARLSHGATPDTSAVAAQARLESALGRAASRYDQSPARMQTLTASRAKNDRGFAAWLRATSDPFGEDAP